MMAGVIMSAGVTLPKAFAGGPRMSAVAASARPRSLYEVLRVGETATAVEIKAAYRSMAKRFHPDVAPVAGRDGPDFVEIHHAYETLSDPAERARYDVSIGRLAPQRRPRFAAAERVRPMRWETDQCW